MTHYPDLSPYAYMARGDEHSTHRNVGWLEGDDPYHTEVPDRRLVDALLHCAFRPSRLCLGFHVCDLKCDQQTDPRALLSRYRGRDVELGNGEIRVVDADGQHYAAPTLVAHYVAVHNYAPPRGFIEGVWRRAREVHILHEEQVQRVRALSKGERLALSLRATEALQAQLRDDWLGAALSAVHEIVETPGEPWRDEVWKLLCGEDREDSLAMSARALYNLLLLTRMGNEFAEEGTVYSAVSSLEHAHDAGLLHWRADLRPSVWEEAQHDSQCG